MNDMKLKLDDPVHVFDMTGKMKKTAHYAGTPHDKPMVWSDGKTSHTGQHAEIVFRVEKIN